MRRLQELDKKAKDILFKTYWKNGCGWIDRKERKISDEDSAYAKSKGLMFDPIAELSHDECIEKIVEILSKISKDKVSKAFLSSLSTRRLDWRSGLASYFIAEQLPPHKYTPEVSGHSYENGVMVRTHYSCGICCGSKYGVTGYEIYKNEDLNILNFERIKWGGVRHGDLIYTLFDLEQFYLTEIPEPTAEDIAVFRSILAVVNSSLSADSPRTLEKNLSTVIKSAKGERDVLIEILACVGILKPLSFNRPQRAKNDWVFAEFWRGEDGYNQEAVDRFFGKYLKE